MKSLFNLQMIRAAFLSYSQGDYQMAALTAEQYTNAALPAIRTAASGVLNYLRPILRTNPVPQMVLDKRSGNPDWPPRSEKSP